MLFAGIAGGVAFVAKKLQGGGQSDNWQSSYTPPAGTEQPPTPPTPAAPQAGGDPLTDPSETRAARRRTRRCPTPPRPRTRSSTPDDPAEVVDLEEGKNK